MANPLASILLIDDLKTFCPSYDVMSDQFYSAKTKFEQKNQNQQFPAQKNHHYYDLKNLQTLGKLMLKSNSSIHKGRTSRVFETVYVHQHNKEQDYVAAKVIRFSASHERMDWRKAQKRLVLSIQANQHMFEQPNGRLFFREIYGCFEITGLVDSLISKVNQNSQEKKKLPNLAHHKAEGVVAIFSEFMNFSLEEILNILQQEKIQISAENRLNLFYQAVKGLNMMDPWLFHCNVTPGSMMLNQISSDEIAQMNQLKIPPASIIKDIYLQLKFIDFKSVAIADEREDRVCVGGTSGFIPDEYLLKNKSHDKIDVFSLGMSFLSVELASLGYEGLYVIDSVFFGCKREYRRKLKEDEKSHLDSLLLVQRMKQIIGSNDYRIQFLNELEVIFPEFKEAVEDKDCHYLSIKPLKYLESSISIYQNMMIVAIKLYFNSYYLQVKMLEERQSYQDEIKGIQEEIDSNTEDTTQLEDEKNYWENRLSLFNASSKLTVDLVNLYLKMITPKYKDRISLPEVTAQIEKIKTDFFDKNQEIIDDIDLYLEEVNSSQSPEKDEGIQGNFLDQMNNHKYMASSRVENQSEISQADNLLDKGQKIKIII